MKSMSDTLKERFLRSPPSREVWIEILSRETTNWKKVSPPSREVWIEIFWSYQLVRSPKCHLPRGRCGLKFKLVFCSSKTDKSPPSREVWIEIRCMDPDFPRYMSPPSREVWIEIAKLCHALCPLRSPPSREVWIEIPQNCYSSAAFRVTSLAGGVD